MYSDGEYEYCEQICCLYMGQSIGKDDGDDFELYYCLYRGDNGSFGDIQMFKKGSDDGQCDEQYYC